VDLTDKSGKRGAYPVDMTVNI